MFELIFGSDEKTMPTGIPVLDGLLEGPQNWSEGEASLFLAIVGLIIVLVPQLHGHATALGVGGAVTFGGVQLKAAAEGGALLHKKAAASFDKSTDRASKLAGYYRRAED